MTKQEKSASVSKLIHDLKRERDELQVHVHLGSLEAKKQWQILSDKLNAMSQRYTPLKDAVEETAEDVWDSLKLVGSEIWDGFKRIRESL